MSEQFLRLVAAAEGDPAPLAEAPPPADTGVSYDDELTELLAKHGAEMLRRNQPLIIPAAEPARYNTALRYAMATGLRYDFDGETFTIHPPS